MDTSLVKWVVMKEGWEQFEFQQDVSEIISDALRDAYCHLEEDAVLDLELVDMSFDK